MGLISLVGDAGTGKSVVLECLRNSLGPDIPCAFIRDSRISFDQLMASIASDLDLDVRSTTKSPRQVFLALIRLATQQAQSGRTVMLIVDEAHNLPADVFAEIIHTASLEHDRVKAIQTVFAGRPELQARLASLNPERVKQRAILSRSLSPFTAPETQEYVDFRLACAGMPKQTVFPRKALQEIYDRSQGLAPAIHAVCERLLLGAYSATSKVCTQEIIDQVFQQSARKLPQIVEDVPIIVAAPEPPPMQTALLAVAVDARRGSLTPRVATDERPAYLGTTRLQIFPHGWFALTGPELAVGPIQPMSLSGCTSAPGFRPSMGLGAGIAAIAVTGLSPWLPESTAAKSRTPRVPQLQASKLIPIERFLRLGPAPDCVHATADPVPDLISHVLQPMHPTAGLQPASMVPCSLVPLRSILTAKYDAPARAAADADSLPLTFANIPQPMHPSAGLQPASMVPGSLVPLRSIRTAKYDVPGRAAVGADPSLSTFANIPQPMHPTAGLQPASIIPCSLVPLRSIRTAKYDVPAGAAVNADPSASTFTNIPQPMHPSAGLLPASIVLGSLVPLRSIRTAKYDVPARAAVNVDPSASTFTNIPQPMHPTTGLQPASIVPCPLVSLAPTRTPTQYVRPAFAAVSADPSPSSFANISHLMHPTTGLQPASIVPCSLVPLAPITTEYVRPAFAQTNASPSPATLAVSPQPTPVGRPAATILSASLHPGVEGPNRLLRLAFSAQPIAPPLERPMSPYLTAQPSLQAHRPLSGLKPADPRRPSRLLPSTWIPRIAAAKNAWQLSADGPATAKQKPAPGSKPPLAFIIPIIVALGLYGAPPILRAAADASRQGWLRAQRAVLDRAAVALDENFRSGLSDWTSRGGSPPAWESDASGFVHPGALALFRPSLGMVDYQMQFLGTIDKNGLSWVARAADFSNYYTIRLAVLKPGPLPSIGVTRYAVIDGVPQKRFTTPLLMNAQADTVYRVRLDIQGDHFALSIQDQPVDSWSEPRLARGSIGFFSEKDAGSRIASLHVRGHYDMLGRLCAFLMPPSISNYR